MKSLSQVWLLATPWTAAYQAPPPLGFSRQEYWSGVPLPSLTLSISGVLIIIYTFHFKEYGWNLIIWHGYKSPTWKTTSVISSNKVFGARVFPLWNTPKAQSDNHTSTKMARRETYHQARFRRLPTTPAQTGPVGLWDWAQKVRIPPGQPLGVCICYTQDAKMSFSS